MLGLASASVDELGVGSGESTVLLKGGELSGLDVSVEGYRDGVRGIDKLSLGLASASVDELGVGSSESTVSH